MFLRLIAASTLALFLVSPAWAKDVPDVLGVKVAEAVKKLSDAGYKPVESKEGKISTFPIGTVGVQEPSGGTELKPGSAVVLFVSSGIWVRDFSGSTIVEAEAEMQKSGVKFEKKDDDAPGKPNGVVIKQEPAPDKWIDASTTKVVFYVATGKIKVPKLYGLSMSNATNQVTALGLKIKVVSGIGSDGSYPPGPIHGKPGFCAATTFIAEIIKSDPVPGIAVPPGHTIEVSTVRKDLSVHEGPCVCDKESPNECYFK